MTAGKHAFPLNTEAPKGKGDDKKKPGATTAPFRIEKRKKEISVPVNFRMEQSLVEAIETLMQLSGRGKSDIYREIIKQTLATFIENSDLEFPETLIIKLRELGHIQ